jgi:hypothetical protein
MAEPIIEIDGDEITVGSFTFSDPDIAEYLEKEGAENRGVIVRDAVFMGLKVFLNERVSLATDTILAKVENRINEILTDPGLQEEGSPFGEILSEITDLKNKLVQQSARQEFGSKAKGDAYEDFIEALLIEEFGHTANVVKTGAQRAAAGRPGKKGDISLHLNAGTPYEQRIAIEAKDDKKLSIEDVKRDTSTTIQQRNVPVVLWAVSKELGQKLLQDGAIDWNIDAGYVLVTADRSDPEKARPLLGAAARLAQLTYQWKLRVDRTIDTQSALEFFARIKTRLQRIKEISGELTTIGNSQQKAAQYSESLYQDLSNDVNEFQEKLEQFPAQDVENPQ